MPSSACKKKIEKDSMGYVRVPKVVYYGAQTQRAVENFPVSFFFNDTATTEIYTLSLHDALPISRSPLPALAIAPETKLGTASSGLGTLEPWMADLIPASPMPTVLLSVASTSP